VYLYVFMYVCMYECMYVCMYVYWLLRVCEFRRTMDGTSSIEVLED
jgi:hypothetical protein